MSATNRPVLEAEPGEIVIFETKDCFSNQIRSEEDLFSSVGWATVNPATGALAVKGAEPADALIVDTLDIEVKDRGVMVAVPGMGAGHVISKTETRIISIVAGMAVIDYRLYLRVEPMIGVIGTAPAATPCRGELRDVTAATWTPAISQKERGSTSPCSCPAGTSASGTSMSSWATERSLSAGWKWRGVSR